MDAHGTKLASAHSDSGARAWEQRIRIGRHEIVSDEPTSAGGTDAGAPPYGLFLASLASCTAMTLQMYAERKGCELGTVHVDLVMTREGDGESITRTIKLGAQLAPEQVSRLAEIADKTPVTKTIKRGTPIVTRFS